jgi:hypothetical protein
VGSARSYDFDENNELDEIQSQDAIQRDVFGQLRALF